MTTTPPPLRVAVVGAGPAGIYSADNLIKNDPDVTVDIFDRLPTPYGLIRYGVAPDHPRIKQIVVALHRAMEDRRIMFTGNVAVGTDIPLAELRAMYDAVIIATGAEHDRSLVLPGIDLPRSHGGAEFVAFYDSHPDHPQTWDLSTTTHVAILGVGNVALDVARMLTRTGDDLIHTDIPEHVHTVLNNSAVTDVHIFARRGPAQAQFTPVELRELDQSPKVQVVVDPRGMELDVGSRTAIVRSRSLRMVVDVLSDWAFREPDPSQQRRRIHIHFLENPTAILGTPDNGVCGLRTERQQLTGDQTIRGTGTFTDWPVQAVYRCVGYRSTPIPDLAFDTQRHVLYHAGGRVLDDRGTVVPGVYVTGWIKRGPAGLIGHTKSDSAETVANLLADAPNLPRAPRRDRPAIRQLLIKKGLAVTDFAGWDRLDQHERTAGSVSGRERIKTASRDIMTQLALAVWSTRGRPSIHFPGPDGWLVPGL